MHTAPDALIDGEEIGIIVFLVGFDEIEVLTFNE